MTIPDNIKIYHIVHVDRLLSIINNEGLYCDEQITQNNVTGTNIGLTEIKQRRLTNSLNSHPELYVGQCVPFYFCPRSIMLYLLFRRNNPELQYIGGQEPIIHLQIDLHTVVKWAKQNNKRWAFTLSNAGAYYFEDRCSLEQLGELNWQAIHATNWQDCKEGKQAEFLVEYACPWQLIEMIGVHSQKTSQLVIDALSEAEYRPDVTIKPEWYY